MSDLPVLQPDATPSQTQPVPCPSQVRVHGPPGVRGDAQRRDAHLAERCAHPASAAARPPARRPPARRDPARLPRCAEEFFAAGQAYVALSRVRSLDLGVVTDADLAADGAWRFAPTGSASLQLDAPTHQQEQAEIERLEGSA